MPVVNPYDFLDDQSAENNDEDTPVAKEDDYDENEDTKDPPEDDSSDTTAKPENGEQPKPDGTTDAATETPKRARSEQDVEDNAATKLGVTKAQLAKAKQLIEKAAKQGLSFQDATTISQTDKTQVWKTAEQSFEFTQPDGAKSKEFAVIATVVFDPTKGTLISHPIGVQNA
jgi:hypothetical protein